MCTLCIRLQRPEESIRSLRMELQKAVSHNVHAEKHTWFSPRAVSALNSTAISLATMGWDFIRNLD